MLLDAALCYSNGV